MENLLIAVRSEALAAALSDALTQYHVHICHNGSQAVELINTIRPKILILDLRLPVLDGFSVLRRVDYTPPVILGLTDILMDSMLRYAHSAGIGNLVLLPCSASRIVTQLSTLVCL